MANSGSGPSLWGRPPVTQNDGPLSGICAPRPRCPEFTRRLETQSHAKTPILLLFVSFLKIGLLKINKQSTGTWKHGLLGENGGKEEISPFSHVCGPLGSPGWQPRGLGLDNSSSSPD